MTEPLIDCPNCSAVWGADEIEESKCYACGYPDIDDTEDLDDDWDDDEFWKEGAA